MHSRRHAEPIRHDEPLDMACAFIAEFFWPYLEANRQLLCLHGAAAEFTGRLVVFPNRYRAGKSLLSACLAAFGQRLFSDDVLPLELDSGLGVAMGIRPRLRIPLPTDLSTTTREFFRSRRGPASSRYVYLRLDGDELAAAGAMLPLGAFVILERDEHVQASLAEVSRGAVLRQVIWQNFARDVHSATIIERLHGIVERTPCYRLRYARAEDAAALLLDAFHDWSQHRVMPPSATETGTPRAVANQRGLSAQHFLQRPGIFEMVLEGERFLAGKDGRRVYHLNPVGSGIWQALSDPMTAENLIDLVSVAFPGVDRQKIEADVQRLLDELLMRDLIRTG